MTSSSSSNTSAASGPDGNAPSRLRRWGRRVLLGIGGLVASVLLLVGLVLLGLQTETGATAAAQFLARQANPIPHTTLTVERASGNWVRSLRLTNVSLTHPDSASVAPDSMAHVDTLAVEYRLGALLGGRLHLTSVSVDAPSVTMRQAPDSTWDWVRLLPTTEDTPDDTSAGMPIQIDQVRVEEGRFAAHFYAEGRDSTAQVQGLTVRAGNVQFSPSIGGSLDTLGLRAHLPADTTDLRLAARGDLSSSRLQLDTLRLTSSRSDVVGHGTAHLPMGPNDSLDDVSLSLRATPLVLGDLTALVPTLGIDPDESIVLDARLTGSDQRLSLTTDAQVREGGRLNASIEATPRTVVPPGASPLQYQFDVQLRNLTTSLIGSPDPAENTLTATLDGRLEGPSLDSLDGSVEAQVTDSRLFGVDLSKVTLASSFQNGTADVDLMGALNGISLSVDGTARPLDAAPSVDLSTRVRNLSLATVAPDAGIDGTITATAQIRGQAMTTDTASYDLNATLANSRINTQPIEGGRLSASLGPDRLQTDASLRFPVGQMEVTGRAALDGSERFTLDRARLDSVNVAALLGDTTESRVTATVRGQGQGLDPVTMEGQTTLSVEHAHYGPHRMSSLNTKARLNEGRLTAEASTRVNGSEWTLAAAAQPFASVPSLELTRGRFQNLDISPFLQDTTQTSALHGTLQGRVRGTTPSALQLDARLTLDSSRVNNQQISEASLNATMQDGHLQSDFSLTTPQGGTQFTMEARPFDERPLVDIPSGTFNNLDVGALAGMPDVATGLSGEFNLHSRGAQLSDLTLDAALTLQESTVNKATLSEGRLVLSAEQGRLTTDGQFTGAGGSIDLHGELDSLDHAATYTLQGKARSLDVSALAGLDTLQTSLQTARWSVEGRGNSLDSLSASTQFSATSVRVDQFRLDTLTVAGRLDRGLFQVDTLTVQSNAMTARGQGPVALTQGAGTSNFNLEATVTDASPLRRLVGMPSLQLQKAVVDAHVYGATGAQQFDGTMEVDGLIYEDMRLSDLTGTFSGQRGTNQLLDRLTIEGKAGYLAAFNLTAIQTHLQATYDGSTLNLSTDVRLDANRQARLEISFQPAAEPMTVRLHALNAQLGPDRWSLLEETSITIGNTYRVGNLRLESGETQRIVVDGTIDPTGTQDFRASLTEVRLGGVAPLLGLSGLDGTATGKVSLTGPASAPVLDGTLDLSLRSGTDEVGTLHLSVGYENLTMALDARFTHTDGSELTLAGSVPTDLRLQASSPVDVSTRPVQLDASTTRFPIDWMDPFFDPASVRSVRGTLTADFDVQGTLGDPELSGSASIADAGAYLPPLETTYRAGAASLQLSGNQLTLENARVRTDNGGSLQATGLITLPELTVGEYDLTLTASDFLAIDTPAYREGVIDGEMTLRGTVRRPVLTGNVQIQSASVYYSEALAQSGAAMTTVSLSPQDQLTLEERFGLRLTEADTTTFDVYQAMAMDLSVQIESDTWLRSNSNPEMNVQFTGDLDLQKESNQDARVFGTIEVVEARSSLRQFGQEFQITQGSLTFNGDPVTPYLNLTAVYDQQARGAQGSEVRITLSLSGRPDNLSPTLSSNPPMSTRNILSYLATGRPADALFSGDSEGGSLATQVALGQASNFVENLAASELGLDVVRLEVRTEGASYLTVGRYLTPRFFASIEQPVLAPSTQTSIQSTSFIPDVTLEYQLTRYLHLRSRSNQQSLQFNLLFEYAY